MKGLTLSKSITFIGHNHNSNGSVFTEGFAYNFMPGDPVIPKIVGSSRELEFLCWIHPCTCTWLPRLIQAHFIMMLSICPRQVDKFVWKDQEYLLPFNYFYCMVKNDVEYWCSVTDYFLCETDTDVSDRNFYPYFGFPQYGTMLYV